MAIITFLSDYGMSDHYVAAVKARILSTNSGINIIDISHQVRPCNIAEAAYVLQSVYKDFPEGTVNLISIGDSDTKDLKHIAVKIEERYFICADNGLLGLVTDSTSYTVVDINADKLTTTFPGKDILAPAAANLANGADITDLGKPMETFQMMLGRRLRASKQQIIGNVIHTDPYGNLITNIDKATFDQLCQGRQFHITFGREKAQRIHENYYNVEPGDCFLIFNSQNLLEIGIKQGNARRLLGLSYDANIIINFV